MSTSIFDNLDLTNISTTPQPKILIPVGSYEATITGSLESLSKKSNTPLVKLDVTLSAPEYENKVFAFYLNLGHPSQVVRDIALRNLKQIEVALGLTSIKGPQDYCFKPIGVVLKVKEAEGEYKEGRAINYFIPVGEITGPDAVQPPPPVKAPAAPIQPMVMPTVIMPAPAPPITTTAPAPPITTITPAPAVQPPAVQPPTLATPAEMLAQLQAQLQAQQSGLTPPASGEITEVNPTN